MEIKFCSKAGQIVNRNNLNQITTVIETLKEVNGLTKIYLLDDNYKSLIAKLEDEGNFGVKECLAKDITLVAVHNSNFREPSSSLVIAEKGKIKLPPLPFDEANHLGAISSSPSKKVHHMLEQILKTTFDEDEATLLISFDLGTHI